MKNLAIVSVLCAGVIAFAGYQLMDKPVIEKTDPTWQPKTLDQRQARRAARDSYYLDRFHDPKTGEIPFAVRNMELSLMKDQPLSQRAIAKTTAGNWQEAGPSNVGGRMRAMAVDVTDANVLIGGGVTGGIWRSTNRGASWQAASLPDNTTSITTIAQDPRPGSTNVWYAAGGERSGSGGDRSGNARIFGRGIYKSVDGGLTWDVLPSTLIDLAAGATPFSRVYRIIVQPTTGHVFFAATGFGVYRSTDGGDSFSMTLPSSGATLPQGAQFPGSSWSDIVVHANGRIFVAATESTFAEGNTPVHQTGLLFSDGEGGPNEWQSVPFTITNPTIGEFRVVNAIAPSNPDIGYVMDFSGNIPGVAVDPAVDPNRTRPGDQVRILRVNFATRQLQDISDNLPTFGPVEDEDDALFFDVFVQGGYNMMISVKPDDEDFLLIGATNLFRSTDGLATPITEQDWIGGYDSLFGFAPNPGDNHPDIHSVVWDPLNPNAFFMTTDGGIYYAQNGNLPTQVNFWSGRNQGLNITQPYHVAAGSLNGQQILLAGTQDNGTPLILFDQNQQEVAPELFDASGGDGAFSQVGNGFYIVSNQNANSRMIRPNYSALNGSQFVARLRPDNAANPAFISVNAIDPTDRNLFYYASGNEFWRNPALDRFSVGEADWQHLTQLDLAGLGITAIGVSTVPEHVLYYAGSAGGQVPQLFRVADSSAPIPTRQQLFIPGIPAGAYIHNIAVNPLDANEIMVVVSNYNVDSLYFSRNGGASFEVVDGNLADQRDGQGNVIVSGPSTRAAAIMPRTDTTYYFVATSTGVYSTETLAGASTVWEREGADVIGSSVMAWIDAQPGTGRVAAASHGRGVFVLDLDAANNVEPEFLRDEPVLGLSSDPARDGHGFELSKVGNQYVMLFYSYDLNGNPEWYLGVGGYENGVFTTGGDTGSSFTRFTYDENRIPRQQPEPGSEGAIRLSYQQQDVDAACNDGVQREGRLAAFEWAIEGETGTWCVQPTVAQTRDNPEYTGTWFAGDADAGWGLSVQNEGATFVSVLYYYDADGIGRWAIGADQLRANQTNLDVDLNMIQVRGYCRTCPLDRENVNAGTMSFSMSFPSRTDNSLVFAVNNVITDVTYQNTPGGSWIRDSVIRMISDPR